MSATDLNQEIEIEIELLLPEIQDVPLMRLHHTNRVVFYWTLCSNLVTAVLVAC